MRFEVKLNGKTIAFSELEGGDPPMGVALGQFIPSQAYRSVQQNCIEHGINGVACRLTVYTDRGTSVECSGGVQIIDVSPEQGDTGIQIHPENDGSPLQIYGSRMMRPLSQSRMAAIL